MAKKEDGLPRSARNDEPAVVNVDPGAAGSEATVIAEMESGQVVGVREIAAPVPLPIPEGGWPADEFTGEAGHFVRDPFTGVRSRAAE